jgi:predicted ArsR family transcriptional regulator
MSEPSLLGPSKTKILRLLLTENKTASNIASSLHIQVSAVRKHLEQLASLGLVDQSFKKGGVGRPKKFYALTEKGKEMFPRAYDALLDKLMGKLVEREGQDRAESLLKSIAIDVARSLDGHGEHNSNPVRHIENGINRLGFEATLNRDDENLTVISRNCPVWKVALAQREVVCRGYHAELLKAALRGKSVNREEWMVDGKEYCRHTVKDGPLSR